MRVLDNVNFPGCLFWIVLEFRNVYFPQCKGNNVDSTESTWSNRLSLDRVGVVSRQFAWSNVKETMRTRQNRRELT